MAKSVLDISLLDILQYYFKYSTEHISQQGKKIYSTKCPIHQEKKGESFTIYDKTKNGKGWDWACFGQCNTGGTAPKLLVDVGLFNSIDEAIKDIEEVFNIKPPEEMNLENFAEYKGFDLEFLKSRGIDNHTHIRQGEEIHGVGVPFFDPEGNKIAIKKRLNFVEKPKYIFTEGKNTIYGLDQIKDFKEEVFIFEGESDALTGMQVGLPSLGIPGANAWDTVKEWIDYFNKFKKIIVVPDKGEAGKKLVNKLAQLFPDKIFILPLPGKFEDVNDFFIFGCNKNKETFRNYFNESPIIPAAPETFKEMIKENQQMLGNYKAWESVFEYYKDEIQLMLFVDQLKEESGIKKSIIEKAYKENYNKYNKTQKEIEDKDADIYIKGKSYYKTIYTKENIYELQLSNFVIHLLHTIEADGDHVRVCQLENENGQISRKVMFDSETLTRVTEFMSECKKAGNYIFKGDFNDLIALNELLLKQEEDIVSAPDHIGRINEKNWLMGSYGIDSNGEKVQADENGIIELDANKYMVRNLNVADEEDTAYMPVEPKKVEDIDKDFLTKTAQTIKENIGGFEAWLALGFAVAGWYSTEIYNHNGEKSFPIFFISGKRNSGKTYLARWLMSVFGFPHIDGKNFGMPSLVSMVRKLGYYSSLPQWYDDYKNGIRDIKARDDFLLGAYNRQGADKGTKSGFGVRSERIRGLLLISGEDTPANNAVFSRCSVIQVSAYSREDSKLDEMLELVRKFPSMGVYFLKNKQEYGSKTLLESIDWMQKILEKNGIDGRTARNRAIFAAAFLYEFGNSITQEEKDEFIDWLIDTSVTTKEETEGDHIVSRFFEDVSTLMERGELVHGKDYKIEDGYIYLWFKGVYDIWTANYRDVDIKRTVLINYLRKEPYIEKENHSKRLGENQSVKKTIVIDYNLAPFSEFSEFCSDNDDIAAEF